MDNNSKNSNVQTFDELSGKISKEERQKILNSMDSQQKVDDKDLFASKTKMTGQKLDEKAEFEQRLKRQSLFQKIYLWIYSIITSSSIEEAFNQSLVKKIARDVESHYPSLIQYRKKLLLGEFHEKLMQLKNALDFFAPHLEMYSSEPGSFIVMIGHVIMPDFEEKLKKSSDPYSIPISEPLTKEQRNDFFQALSVNLQNIPDDYLKEMYRFARVIFWLNEFVKMPVDKIISKFSMTEDHVLACLFSFVKLDFSKLAKVMCNYVQVDERILDTFVTVMQNNSQWTWEPVEIDAESQDLYKEFYSSAKLHITMIESFLDAVPVAKISKVVMENSLYTPEAMSGGENWLELFTEQWKQNFKKRVAQRERDYTKEVLKKKLEEQFKVSSFPLFPFRPWENLGAFTFKYEFSLGFVNFFIKQRYSAYMTIFKAISLEGQFAVKDNEREFTEAVDSFVEINSSLEVLATQLSAAGEYGLEFSKYEAYETPTEDVIRKMHLLFRSLEDDASGIAKDFRRLCHRMIMLLSGFVSDKYSGKYGAIMNLRNMQRRLGDFYQMVVDARDCFKNAYDMSLKLDEVENPKDSA
ncbi:MAG: DUF5312 domain-containing protein [Treponema sp.]|nr:DUF5312 domain-containing protein [Treponema sp.]